MERRPLIASTLLLTAALVACSGTDGSTFSDDPPPAGGGAGPAGGFSTDPLGVNAACVTAVRNATLPPVNLVLMYDKSGSMGNPQEGGDAATKWVPVNTGMKAFFADPKSSGYAASLQFFPAPGDLATTCSADYATPLVPLTSLASSKPLASALDATSPQGGTPTLPALQGAIAFAKRTAQARADEKTVVVLVTDGEPGVWQNGQLQPGCANNDVSHVADAARDAFSASPSIPTYVIGVGPSLGKLDAVAKAGGTDHAFMISVANPSETSGELQGAFEAIRSQVKVSCSFSVPEPPAGEQLDKDRINVGFTSGAGAATPMVYSKDCTAANGWRYDDPSSPTKIELCPAACGSAQGDPNGKLTIAMGCKTNVEVR